MTLHNLNEVLATLNRVAVRTDRGTYIRADDLLELGQQMKSERGDAAPLEIKSFEQARLAARQDPGLAVLLNPSVVEDVKREEE